MAKKIKLTDASNTTLYPISLSDCIYHEGTTLDVLLTEGIPTSDIFITMFNVGAGDDGGYKPEQAPDESHPFLLNGIWLTLEEALLVHLESSGLNMLGDYAHAESLARTFYSIRLSQSTQETHAYAFSKCSDLEVVKFVDAFGTRISSTTFYLCNNLTRIIGPVQGVTGQALNLPKLEEAEIVGVTNSFSLSKAANISLKSLYSAVTTRLGNTTVTITVHPDVYAKLTDLSNTEWYNVMTLGIANSITFAT